jgi:hypothetical protein
LNPKISYLKNDQPIPASARIKTHYNPTTGLVSIKLEDANVYDSGAFKIRVENPYGKAETAGIVYINKAPVIDTRPVIDPDAFKYLPQSPIKKEKPIQEQLMPPNFIVGLPANFKLHEGEPIKLNCQVEGNPKPTVDLY